MKTIKQIADELEVDKQRVYRYIKKNHITEAHQESGVMYYDEAAEIRIKQGFCKNDVRHEAHHEAHHEAVIDVLLKQSEMLRNELAAKDRQIEELSNNLSDALKALDQSQQLHAIAEQKIMLLEQQNSDEASQDEKTAAKHGFFSFWKK